MTGARLPPSFLGHGCMDDLITERSFDSKATLVSYVLGFHVIHGCLYNQVLADIRSTGAEIKCLYCIRKHRNYQAVLVTASITGLRSETESRRFSLQVTSTVSIICAYLYTKVSDEDEYEYEYEYVYFFMFSLVSMFINSNVRWTKCEREHI